MSEQGKRRTMQGIVTSDKMDKTVVVNVSRVFKHPLYGKVVKRQKKYKAHDAANECRVGDVVELIETRPLSAQKHWAVKRVMRKPVA
ncbi:30S ribosomal protein S17 [bacterium]|nr:30S ribosomal protein S17 [bacterium]